MQPNFEIALIRYFFYQPFPIILQTTLDIQHYRETTIYLYGHDIRTIQELLGQKSVETTMIYTHVIKRGGMAVRSPLDS